ncbi:MAG: DUF4142 domain-containing protein [Gemmatimonadaceae bacterium]
MNRTFRSCIVILGALVLGAACSAKDRDIATRDTAAGVIDSAPTNAVAAVAALLSDENVMALVDTTYAAALEMELLAQGKASDPRVKALANRGVGQHQLLRKGAANVIDQLKISPALPDRDPIKDHASAMNELRSKTGKEFDRAFLDRTVKMQEELLDEVDDALKKRTNQTIRTFLEQTKGNIEADLKAARDLKGTIG